MAVHVEYVKLTFSVLALSAKNLLVNIKNIVNKKIPSVPPLLQDNKYVTDLEKQRRII